MASLEKQVSHLTRENLQLKNTIMYFYLNEATTKAGSNSSDSISRKSKKKNKTKKQPSKITKNKQNDSHLSCGPFSYHSYSLLYHLIFALSSNLCFIIESLLYHLNITQIQIHNIMASAISIIVHLFFLTIFKFFPKNLRSAQLKSNSKSQ